MNALRPAQAKAVQNAMTYYIQHLRSILKMDSLPVRTHKYYQSELSRLLETQQLLTPQQEQRHD